MAITTHKTNTVSRVKRPQPEQSGPIRSPMAPPQVGGPADMFTAAGAAVCGVLENGVRTAYAVIDEYMRRGQEAARGMFNDPNRRGPMSDSGGNFGGGYNSFNNPMANPMAAMAAQWMSAMQAWAQMFSSYMPPGWQQAGMNPLGYAQGAPVAVAVKLSSARPTEVAVSLMPGVDPLSVVCDALRAEGSGGKPIEGVTIGRDGAAIQVGVKIAANQAAGRYHGFIKRRSDQGIVGELTVTVS
ncbi:MAG TPA: hypothetical protein VF730_08890 [Terracidiphilus sp.]